MTPERLALVRSLFDAAVELEPARREGYLDEACGGDEAIAREVQALLRVDARAEGSRPLFDLAPGVALRADDLSGATIGSFRLLRQIGAGGMGTVYEAQQQRPQRIVALKTLAVRFPSERARRRFEDEAEILARLRHPAIAQVLEAGSWQAGGLDVPWFALELIEQPRPIDRYAREERLDARRIAALFRSVCDAIHFAHQRGVIHRDLKPANVLVDRQGQPKVIDFGIARVVEHAHAARQTLTGEILGMLEYMPPERLEEGGDTDDTASDVYALGVMLYELLAGCLPFSTSGLPPARVIDSLRELEPGPPSRKARPGRVPKELDWITLRAMARARSDRYASVAELAQDLERWSRDEVVSAGPPSAIYRLRKLARRHRVLLAVSAVVLLSLAVGAVVAAFGWHRVAGAEALARGEAVRAGRAETRALRDAATLAEVKKFQERILRGAYGTEQGKDVRLADVVGAAAREVEKQAFDDPRVEAGVRCSLAISFLGLGQLDEAERQLLRARARIEEHGIEPADPTAILVTHDLAVVYEQRGNLELAEREARAALACRERNPDSENDRDHAIARCNFATLLLKRGQPQQALELANQALAAFERLGGAASETAIAARTCAASALAELGRDDAAMSAFDATCALAERHLHEDHPARLALATSRAGHLHKLRRIDEYVRACEELAAARERLHGPSHPTTLTAWTNLATAQTERGDPAAAEATLRRVIAAREAAGTQDGYGAIVTKQNLTVVLRRQGRTAEAETWALAVRDEASRRLPARHWLVGIVTKEHGACLRELGRFQEAEAELLAGVEIVQAAHGGKDYRTQKVIAELVLLYEAMQRPEEAAKWRERQTPAAEK